MENSLPSLSDLLPLLPQPPPFSSSSFSSEMSPRYFAPKVALKRSKEEGDEDALSKPLKAVKLEAQPALSKREGVKTESKHALHTVVKSDHTSTSTNTIRSSVVSVATAESSSETDVDPDSIWTITGAKAKKYEDEIWVSSDDDDEVAFNSDEDTAVASSSAPSKAHSPIDTCAGNTVIIQTPDGKQSFKPLSGFDTFWKYSSERHSIEEKRRQGKPQP